MSLEGDPYRAAALEMAQVSEAFGLVLFTPGHSATQPVSFGMVLSSPVQPSLVIVRLLWYCVGCVRVAASEYPER